MKTPKLIHLRILFAVMLIALSCSARKDDSILIQEFNKKIIELPSAQPLTYTDSFLDRLLDWGQYSVIGLGESSHGVKSFFELKHRLFKYLVENHDYRVLAYEFSFRTSLRVNDYVFDGRGDIDSLFAGELWIQDNYEVQNLIQWMKNHNSDKEVKDRINFVGIDNQLDAFYPDRTIDRINSMYPELIEQNMQLASEIENLGYNNYEEITREEYEYRRGLFEELLDRSKFYFQWEEEEDAAFNTKIAIHLVESLINSNQWLFNIFTGKENNRDLDLAENLLWVKENFNSKVAIWAHSSHVQNNPNYYEKGSGSMGYHIRKSLKDKYLIITTAFTNGRFKAVMEGPDGKDTAPLDCEISGNPPSESLNEIFHQAKHEDFFLNLGEIQASSLLYSYLDTVRPILGIGDWFEGSAEFHYSNPHCSINILNATDLIFYYSKTEPLTVHGRFSQ